MNWQVFNSEGYSDDVLVADFISCQGDHREHMEDGFVISNQKIVDSDMTCYVIALMDGHGGKQVMNYMIHYFPVHIYESLQGITFKKLTSHEAANRITQACLCLNDELKQIPEVVKKHVGSTLSALLVFRCTKKDSNRVKSCVVNVGDSMIASTLHVKDHPWNARCKKCLEHLELVTEAHDLDNKSEMARFKKQTVLKRYQQYIVDKNGTGVNMTRAFGDFNLGDFILPKPSITFLDQQVCFVTLGSDGIWDEVTPKEIRIWLQKGACKNTKSTETTHCLMNERATKIQHDNFTLGVVFLNHQYQWTSWK